MEIGSFEGYSTILLAKAVGVYGKVFAIDPHTGRLCESDEEDSPSVGDSWQMFNRNIRQAGVADKIRALKLKSEDAALGWQEPVGMLFVDGSHRYEDVKKDLLLWKEHLMPGSIIVFHDMWMVGVRRVIAEKVLSDQSFSNFIYAPCCMLAATYLGTGHHGQFLQRRSFWRLLLGLRGFIEERPTLRRWLLAMLRWVS